jgi:hypothetical protein
MRRIERFNLIDRIGRELQARMSYSDIDIFLKSFGVDTQKQILGANSKWIYVKELLAETNEAIVLQIADELEIVHGHTVTGGAIQEEAEGRYSLCAQDS